MSRTDDIIDKTKRKEPEAKKWKVVAGIVVGLVFGGALFVGSIICLNPVLDEYFDDNKEIENLYDFYDLNVGYNTTSVYFVGASHVAESVYPAEINRILKENGYENVTVYSAYVSSEGPLDRLVHLQNLIASKPSMVIYGISASKVSQDEINEDNILIVKDRIQLIDDSLSYYTPEEVELLTGSLNPFDMKRFISSALIYKLNPVRSFEIDYSVDPLGGEYARKYIWGANVAEETIAYLYDPNHIIEYSISEESRAVQAFNYILTTLEDNGIDVVVVNAPINPLASDKITKETRDNYYSVLNNTGYEWYDLEYSIPPEYFFDGTHPTFDGAMNLAPIWADIIIQEMS